MAHGAPARARDSLVPRACAKPTLGLAVGVVGVLGVLVNDVAVVRMVEAENESDLLSMLFDRRKRLLFEADVVVGVCTSGCTLRTGKRVRRMES